MSGSGAAGCCAWACKPAQNIAATHRVAGIAENDLPVLKQAGAVITLLDTGIWVKVPKGAAMKVGGFPPIRPHSSRSRFFDSAALLIHRPVEG